MTRTLVLCHCPHSHRDHKIMLSQTYDRACPRLGRTMVLRQNDGLCCSGSSCIYPQPHSLVRASNPICHVAYALHDEATSAQDSYCNGAQFTIECFDWLRTRHCELHVPRPTQLLLLLTHGQYIGKDILWECRRVTVDSGTQGSSAIIVGMQALPTPPKTFGQRRHSLACLLP